MSAELEETAFVRDALAVLLEQPAATPLAQLAADVVARYSEAMQHCAVLLEALRWHAQSVHVAYHNGPFESCAKNTCSHAREVAERIRG